MSLQPVYDAETPRSERDNNSADMQKHRAFDNPFAMQVLNLSSHTIFIQLTQKYIYFACSLHYVCAGSRIPSYMYEGKWFQNRVTAAIMMYILVLAVVGKKCHTAKYISPLSLPPTTLF